MFNLKDGYNLELQMPETMNLLSSAKTLIDKSRNGEKVPNHEMAETFLVQCNLVQNHYRQKSEVLFTFMPNKSYSYLLNVEPRNIVFLKTVNI